MPQEFIVTKEQAQRINVLFSRFPCGGGAIRFMGDGGDPFEIITSNLERLTERLLAHAEADRVRDERLEEHRKAISGLATLKKLLED